MDNNFFGFSAKSFEQFIQALAVLAIGPNVEMFGSGPDGGREATFQGSVNYPSSGDPWKGYGVIQAKCKEKTEGTAIDQEWALEMLDKELKVFSKEKSKRKKPEFYIFATNVVLTPVATTGGRDRANNLLTSYYGKLPLKGHAIWDCVQLEVYLLAYEKLRDAFSIQLTSGDVMAKLANAINSLRPDFKSIAAAFLMRQLHDDEDAKLDQAGHRTDQRTPLARVFVDLPAEWETSDEPPDEENSRTGQLKGFLQELIEDGSQKLDPRSINELRQQKSSLRRFSSNNATNRWVLIGGPGSGKSTLSQFLAQVYRASLIDRLESHQITQELATIIQQTKNLCREEGIPWPATPRFPFRVELSTFARALASENTSERVQSLAEYLAVRMKGDRALRVEDLLLWLSKFPTLLVLDGLDEVPATSNRDAVCGAIQHFFAEVAQVNADLITLATTRPSGYADEFGRESFEYRYLPPLAIKRSLRYAKRFAEARFGQQSSKVQEMSNRLLEASQDQLTARLMRTPLQVTFMATLVAAGGRPPRDRWKLFRDYYDTIYKREQQKADGELRSVLDNQDTLIHRTHHDVGFLLQVHGESAGTTDAMMPFAVFSGLIESHLNEEGWDETDLRKISRCISQEAKDRLVFLTSRVAGQISFDVRSLQEYMAAECITAGSELYLHERLSTITALPYWRNVFLFAAGKCFALPQLYHLRALIRQICEETNDIEVDKVLGTLRIGSRLAIDLLEDGTVTNAPNFARALARLALETLVDSPLNNVQASQTELSNRLASVYEPKLDEVYQKALTTALINHVPLNVRAWGVLIGLLNRNVSWAKTMAEDNWPSDIEQQSAIVSDLYIGDSTNKWLVQQIVSIAPKLSPKQLPMVKVDELVSEVPKWFQVAALIYHRTRTNDIIKLNLGLAKRFAAGLRFNAAYTPAARNIWLDSGSLRETPNPSHEWLPLIAAVNFVENPTHHSLADQLEMLLKDVPYEHLKSISGMPWPIQACLKSCGTAGELAQLITSVRDGALGEMSDWEQAERRWVEDGVMLVELTVEKNDTLPFDGSIKDEGLPPVNSIHWEAPSSTSQASEHILELYNTQEDDKQKEVLGLLLLTSLLQRVPNEESSEICISAGTWKKIWIKSWPIGLCILALSRIRWGEQLDPDWLNFFDALGNSESKLHEPSSDARCPVLLEQLAANYVVNTSLHGVLMILAGFALSGNQVIVPSRLLDTSRFSKPSHQLAACILSITQNSMEDVQQICLAIVKIQNEDPSLGAVDLALTAVTTKRTIGPADEELVILLRASCEALSPKLTHRCDQVLSWLLSRRKSSLLDNNLCSRLKFPWIPLEPTTQP